LEHEYRVLLVVFATWDRYSDLKPCIVHGHDHCKAFINTCWLIVLFYKILNFVKKKSMNIQAEKLEIMRMILETENPSILESVKSLFKKDDKKDFWKTLTKDQKEEILNGIEEVENGDVVDYENFMKKHR
jgi:hypothetical protein